MKARAVTCPHCGQQSVRLRIMNAIERAGPDGISRADLTEMIYGDATVNPCVISVHVNHINAALAGTGHQVKGGKNGYRIVRTSREAA
jgi:DNA-binding winged helix-turn-helix (wHTH) protein